MLIDYLKNSVGTLIPAASALIFSLIAAEALGMESYGELVFVLAAVDLIDKVVGVSTWQIYQKFHNKANEQEITNNVFTTDVFFGIISLVFNSIFLSIIYLTNTGYSSLYFFLLIISISRIFDVSIGIYRCKGNYGYLSVILSIGPIIKVALSVLSFRGQNALFYIILALVLEKLITLILKYLSIKKARLNFTFSMNKEYKTYLYNLYFDSTLRVLPRRLDVIVLSYLVSSKFVGAYQIIKDLALLVNYLVEPLYQISFRKMKLLSPSNALKYVRYNTLKFLAISPFIFLIYITGVQVFTEYFYFIDIKNKLSIISLLVIPNIIAFVTVLYAPYCLVVKTSVVLRRAQVCAILVYILIVILGSILHNIWIIISSNIFYYISWSIYLRKSIYV